MNGNRKYIYRKKAGNSAVKEDEITTMELELQEPEVRYGSSTIIGKRMQQQDRLICESYGEGILAAVCDGMGGLADGDKASQAFVDLLQKDKIALAAAPDPAAFLKEEALAADQLISRMKKENSKGSGTTIVSAVIQKNALYWISVGDSRIYFYRKGKLLQVTRDHNYKLSLDILKKRGSISKDLYQSEMEENGEALISYIGMGNLSLIDGSTRPVPLQAGDRIMLCSDGLYKSISKEEILAILQKYRNAQETADALTAWALQKKKPNQDNASVIVLNFG